MRTLRIGTRGSRLALAQTELVKSALSNIYPELGLEVYIIKTSGDELSDVPLDSIGGKGVFVKDIEKKLMDMEIDIAVHSLKDMSSILHTGLRISAYLKRENPFDMLFSQGKYSLDTLPKGSRVGTSSIRRRCQLKNIRPDLHIIDIRGNVPTRLKKVGTAVDAVILAAAGVIRLNLPLGIVIDPQIMLPSPGQGVIAVETRLDDTEIHAMVKILDHEETHICAEAERAFLKALGPDCNLPAGAYARLDNDGIFIEGMLGTVDEALIKRISMKGSDSKVGTRLAQALMEQVHKGRTQ